MQVVGQATHSLYQSLRKNGMGKVKAGLISSLIPVSFFATFFGGMEYSFRKQSHWYGDHWGKLPAAIERTFYRYQDSNSSEWLVIGFTHYQDDCTDLEGSRIAHGTKDELEERLIAAKGRLANNDISLYWKFYE